VVTRTVDSGPSTARPSTETRRVVSPNAEVICASLRRAPDLDDPDWLVLDEAGDRARVTEVSEAGSVPFLQVANGADRPLLLLDGEELLGAKQNRILNTTVLVAVDAGGDLPLGGAWPALDWSSLAVHDARIQGGGSGRTA
jgi:hypothetical protein